MADALAILALWLPLDFRLFRDVWSWPEGGAPRTTLNVVLAVDLALLLFVAFRQLGGVGYRFRPGWNDLSANAINLTICLAFVIPLGLATGFVRFNPDTGPASFAFSFLAIFLTIAIPEELLFRGLIQNFLQKTWGHSGRALVVTSVVFGLAHLNNGTHPDWRYVFLASIAGFFYGRAYLQSGGLMAPALVHASIDSIWRGFFKRCPRKSRSRPRARCACPWSTTNQRPAVGFMQWLDRASIGAPTRSQDKATQPGAAEHRHIHKVDSADLNFGQIRQSVEHDRLSRVEPKVAEHS